MTVTHRRILYLTFFLLFCIIAPTILLMSAGYRFDLANRRITSVGIITLYVENRPDRIFLDNDEREVALFDPLKIANVTPGVHTVRLEKDGFLPWEQVVTVHGGESTTLDGVRLFPDPLPVTMAERVALVEPSPDRRLLAVQRVDGTVLIINAESNTVTPVETNSGTVAALRWSSDSQRLLLWHKQSASATIVDMVAPIVPPEHVSLPPSVDDLTWHPTESRSLLFSRAGMLSSYSLRTGETSELAADVLDWSIPGSERFFILQRRDDGVAILYGDQPGGTPYALLPALDHPRLFGEKNLTTVVDEDSEQSFALSLAGQTLTELDGAYVHLSPSGQHLIVGDTHDLSLFHLDTKEEDLLIRSTDAIRQVNWLEETYLLLHQDSGLSFLETIGEPPYVITPFVDAPIDAFWLSAERTNLWYMQDGRLQKIGLAG